MAFSLSLPLSLLKLPSEIMSATLGSGRHTHRVRKDTFSPLLDSQQKTEFLSVNAPFFEKPSIFSTAIQTLKWLRLWYLHPNTQIAENYS